MRSKRLTLLAAVVAVCGAFGVMAGNASAIIIAEDGHWCGIDEPQRLPQLHEYLLHNEGSGWHHGDCSGAFTHVFNHYKTRSAKVVTFQIHQRKFLKEMFVGREKWIGSADIGFHTRYRASENGHDVEGDFLGDFETEGILTLHGQRGYFYAIWVSG
jgi:hypothetical protein